MTHKWFKSEAEMCAKFIAAIPKDWTAYPETAGWDILLVRDDGLQVGVEAKLRLGVEVFNQALEQDSNYTVVAPGPDHRAVLVPDFGVPAWDRIAAALSVTVVRMSDPNPTHIGYRNSVFRPELPNHHRERFVLHEEWHDCCPVARHKLPDYVPDVGAGHAAPIQLTEWKIKAIKLSITLKRRGYVTRADFKHLRLDRNRWIAARWLHPDGRKGVDRYTAGRMPDFETQHPVNWKQIEADFDTWKRVTIADNQEELL